MFENFKTFETTLARERIPFAPRQARLMTMEDYEQADL